MWTRAAPAPGTRASRQLGNGRLVVASVGWLEVFVCSAAGVRSVKTFVRDKNEQLMGIYPGVGAADLWEVSATDGQMIVRWLQLK